MGVLQDTKEPGIWPEKPSAEWFPTVTTLEPLWIWVCWVSLHLQMHQWLWKFVCEVKMTRRAVTLQEPKMGTLPCVKVHNAVQKTRLPSKTYPNIASSTQTIFGLISSCFWRPWDHRVCCLCP